MPKRKTGMRPPASLMEETRTLSRPTRRNLLNVRTLRRAIGVSGGKSLELTNDCARVLIVQCEGPRGAKTWEVSGDVDKEDAFTDLPKAMAYALEGLALYMDGSPNR